MAIGFRALTQIGSGGATDPTSATTLPSGTATGDLVVAVCAIKYAATTITAPSGWQVVTNNEVLNTGLTDSGNDAGNVRAALFFREKDAGWSTIPAYDLSGVPNCTMIGAISYTKGAGEVWATPVCANAADNAVGSTGIDPAASGTTISFAAGDWFGSVAAVNGDAGTLGAHTVTVAGVTFGTQVTRLDGTTSSGTDMRVHSVDKPYSSGTASAGPDGSLALTTGGASGAGVMVFYRLRAVTPTTVSATLSAPLSELTATLGATPKHPATLSAPLSAVLGGMTATITAVPKHQATLAAPLGGLTATISATPKPPATLSAPLGALTATVSAKVTVPVTLSAPLDALTATITAVPKKPVTLSAPLSALTATITAVPKKPVTLSAPLGALTATITAVPKKPAIFSASLGGLTASLAATVTSGVVTVPATLAAPLGSLTGSIAAKVRVPAALAAPLGGLTGTIVSTVKVPVILNAPLSGVTGTISAKVKIPAALSAPLAGVTGNISAKVKIPVALSAPLGGVTGTITSKVIVPATFYAPLGALAGTITVVPPGGNKMYLGDTLVSAVYLGDTPVLIGGTS